VVFQGVFVLGRRGFGLLELLVVLAVVGLLGATSMPWLLTYWRSATLNAAAYVVAAGLNRARQLAISQSRRVCVEVVGNRYRYSLNACGGDPWTEPGSDATGFFRLANNVGLTTNVSPVFDYLGAANPGATFTVTNPQGGATLRVVVSVAGRVRVCPAAGCP
jgi:prepilin-type N-terminal cleavage/methylation domain-containing protein